MKVQQMVLLAGLLAGMFSPMASLAGTDVDTAVNAPVQAGGLIQNAPDNDTNDYDNSTVGNGNWEVDDSSVGNNTTTQAGLINVDDTTGDVSIGNVATDNAQLLDNDLIIGCCGREGNSTGAANTAGSLIPNINGNFGIATNSTIGNGNGVFGDIGVAINSSAIPGGLLGSGTINNNQNTQNAGTNVNINSPTAPFSF
jgi:hypothetical protein